jgi:predicted acylesterase/phospholipase RssA
MSIANLPRPVGYVMRDGRLLPALLASAAIPGVFPAVQLESLRLYDGGLVANARSAIRSAHTPPALTVARALISNLCPVISSTAVAPATLAPPMAAPADGNAGTMCHRSGYDRLNAPSGRL